MVRRSGGRPAVGRPWHGERSATLEELPGRLDRPSRPPRRRSRRRAVIRPPRDSPPMDRRGCWSRAARAAPAVAVGVASAPGTGSAVPHAPRRRTPPLAATSGLPHAPCRRPPRFPDSAVRRPDPDHVHTGDTQGLAEPHRAAPGAVGLWTSCARVDGPSTRFTVENRRPPGRSRRRPDRGLRPNAPPIGISRPASTGPSRRAPSSPGRRRGKARLAVPRFSLTIADSDVICRRTFVGVCRPGAVYAHDLVVAGALALAWSPPASTLAPPAEDAVSSSPRPRRGLLPAGDTVVTGQVVGLADVRVPAGRLGRRARASPARST